MEWDRVGWSLMERDRARTRWKIGWGRMELDGDRCGGMG